MISYIPTSLLLLQRQIQISLSLRSTARFIHGVPTKSVQRGERSQVPRYVASAQPGLQPQPTYLLYLSRVNQILSYKISDKISYPMYLGAVLALCQLHINFQLHIFLCFSHISPLSCTYPRYRALRVSKTITSSCNFRRPKSRFLVSWKNTLLGYLYIAISLCKTKLDLNQSSFLVQSPMYPRNILPPYIIILRL